MYTPYSESFEIGVAPSVLELRDAHDVVQRYLETRLMGGGRRDEAAAFAEEVRGTLELVLFQIETCLPSGEESGGEFYEYISPHESIEALSWCEMVLERLSEEALAKDSASPLASWLRELAVMHAALSAEIVSAWIAGDMGEELSSPASDGEGPRAGSALTRPQLAAS